MLLDDLTRIRHMIDAASEALSFCEGIDEAAFKGDSRTHRAVIQCIEVIGEAANGLSEAARQRLSKVPWHQIVGMRHRLIHVYFDINLSLVWEVVRKDLRPLLEALHTFPGIESDPS